MNDGSANVAMIHVEIQSQRDNEFAKRMAICNHRIFERYGLPAASLAVLADNGVRWRPRSFGYCALPECDVRTGFAVAKLHDYARRVDELLEHDNPFALLTAAHLLAQRTRSNFIERRKAKWRVLRVLGERDWDRQRIMDLMLAIDWMMRLPHELDQKLWQDIKALKEEKAMERLSPLQRIARDEARQEGLAEGRAEGLAQGQALGQAQQLEHMLRHRFGDLPEPIQVKLQKAKPEQLMQWSTALLDAPSLEAVFG